MTGLALWNIRVLAPVAEGTGKGLVLGHRLVHQLTDITMTGNTEIPRRGNRIVDLQGMMGRMTTKTVSGNLTGGMRLMALATVRDLAMDIVAEGTGLLGMGAFVAGEILARTFVAGQAGLLDVSGEVECQRLMGVGVAGETVFQLKMRSAGVTALAFWDRVGSFGKVLNMAIAARHLGLVLAAVGGNGCRLLGMAFDTVGGHQFRSSTGSLFSQCPARKNCKRHYAE